MSYARFSGDSDVYVYEHYAGFIECCGCRFSPISEGEEYEVFPRFSTAREALTHLDWHVREGDMVPERAFLRIKEEHPDLDAPIEPYVTPPEVEERRRKKMQELLSVKEQND